MNLPASPSQFSQLLIDANACINAALHADTSLDDSCVLLVMAEEKVSQAKKLSNYTEFAQICIASIEQRIAREQSFCIARMNEKSNREAGQ